MLPTLPMPSKPYIYWLVGLCGPKPLISAGFQVLHGGGRAGDRPVTLPEGLRKLFIFL